MTAPNFFYLVTTGNVTEYLKLQNFGMNLTEFALTVPSVGHLSRNPLTEAYSPKVETYARNPGSLNVEEGGKYSASERNAAQFMADLGHDVTLRRPSGTRAGGKTSDLLVNGSRYDVYAPQTTNPGRIIGAIQKKKTQAEGIVLDLSKTTVTREQLGNVLARVQHAGAKGIKDIVIMGGE